MAAEGSAACDGVQSCPKPSVGCAHATTNRPSAGAGVVGTYTVPDDCAGCPDAVVVVYTMRQPVEPAGAVVRGVAETMVPVVGFFESLDLPEQAVANAAIPPTRAKTKKMPKNPERLRREEIVGDMGPNVTLASTARSREPLRS